MLRFARSRILTGGQRDSTLRPRVIEAQPPPMPTPDPEPLVVYGPANHEYDFGPGHPFTPRRLGPGISMLEALGADPSGFLAPARATSALLETVHTRRFLASVERLSDYPEMAHEEHVTDGDTPPFYGMFDAGAAIVGGTVAAMDEILAGRRIHAFHPGGGLHHAFPSRATGFCVFNDVAIAIRRAREAGHRVLYVDTDVHHGDGVEGIFWDDPLVQTVSIHESGLTLFPGTGWVEDRGGEGAEGSAVNIPLEHGTSDASWLAVLESVVPAVADAFRPTILVTLNGSDAHAYDPLANVQLTTTAFARAATLLDRIAHEHAGGRWLATGGGGYDVYRAVPRNWGLIWLAQAHRDVPDETPPEWRARWADEATRYRGGPPPAHMLDPDGVAMPESPSVAATNRATAAAALEHTLHVLAERHA
jgi:acetoin utilization protein AcuC